MQFILKFLSKQQQHWNEVQHMSKRTHEHRNIVVPCPDLLYSTVACNFLKDPDVALVFNAPSNVYSSLGVYDDTARCVDIVSHSSKSLNVVVVGPDVVGTDDEILTSLSSLHYDKNNNNNMNENEIKILRMPTPTGLLLHRLLMSDPSDWQNMESLQSSSIKCETETLSRSVLAPQRGFLSSLCRSCSSYVHTLTAIPCLIVLSCLLLKYITYDISNVVKDLLVPILMVFIGGLLLGGCGAFVTMKLLKKPRVVQWTNLMKLEVINGWNFNVLDTTGAGGLGLAGPFVHLIFFLHGALGLLPSEVLYGASTTALSQRDTSTKSISLRNGESYNIDVSELNLCCSWWSITVYGSDLYLVPNEAGIYSVNSFQIQEAMSDHQQRSSMEGSRKVRIVCSPNKPEQLEEEELFWLPMPKADSEGKDHQGCPRFVLRGIKSCNIVMSSSLTVLFLLHYFIECGLSVYLPENYSTWTSDVREKQVSLPQVSQRFCT